MNWYYLQHSIFRTKCFIVNLCDAVSLEVARVCFMHLDTKITSSNEILAHSVRNDLLVNNMYYNIICVDLTTTTTIIVNNNDNNNNNI